MTSAGDSFKVAAKQLAEWEKQFDFITDTGSYSWPDAESCCVGMREMLDRWDGDESVEDVVFSVDGNRASLVVALKPGSGKDSETVNAWGYRQDPDKVDLEYAWEWVGGFELDRSEREQVERSFELLASLTEDELVSVVEFWNVVFSDASEYLEDHELDSSVALHFSRCREEAYKLTAEFYVALAPVLAGSYYRELLSILALADYERPAYEPSTSLRSSFPHFILDSVSRAAEVVVDAVSADLARSLLQAGRTLGDTIAAIEALVGE